MPRWMWAPIALALGLMALAGLYAVVEQRAQAVLDARHSVPPSAVSAATTPEAIARGGHLVTVTDCAGCHGADLTGRMLSVSGSAVDAPNLTVATRKLGDAQLDAAIRHGLRPDGTTELAMPSQDYSRFTDDEMAASFRVSVRNAPNRRLAWSTTSAPRTPNRPARSEG